MRFRILSALIALATMGLGIASCTQDFDQFTPQDETIKCAQGEKVCADLCVAIDDATYGCRTGCDPCVIAHASAKCGGNYCAIDTCDAGYADCDGDVSNGCEKEIDTDAFNCGGCDLVCSAINAMALCNEGKCSVGDCNPGFVDCDMSPGNGCEAKLSDDPKNCGMCGTQCSDFQTCKAGKCVNNPCPTGTADCNSDFSDGCETTLGTAEACSYCADVCNLANSNEACVQLTCVIDTCMDGWGDCNNMDGDGCEVDITTISNCGSCNNPCPAADNAMPTCTDGLCGFECLPNFADCNKDPSDGCEADLQSSGMHCGVCDRACSADNTDAVVCNAGVCTPQCAAGFSDCATPPIEMADDGCETASGTDIFNCGACGRMCVGTNVASLSCSGGVCNSTCDVGYANCSQPATGTDNGCEQLVQQSTANCGGCGNACSNALDCDRGTLAQKYCGCSTNSECGAGATCNGTTGVCTCGGTNVCVPGEDCASNGTCRCNGGAGCTTGQTCCQSPAGCFDLTADAANCGACGRQCPSGFICAVIQLGIPSCRCNEDADCNAGTAGTCDATGTCTCGATQCGVGERCLANGTCG